MSFYFYPRSPCGERRWARSRRQPSSNFYPRSPCGERHYDRNPHHGHTQISIHALLAESDVLGAVTSPSVIKFLSTLSLRRATVFCRALQNKFSISIHALLAESDKKSRKFWALHPVFLSTLSLRRATALKVLCATDFF